MDGNGRWAQLRSRPRTYGHIKGARVAKKIITECSELGIKTLTLYAFSTENWLRPQAEVSFLMNLLRRYLKKETENLVRQNIRFTAIGDLSRLPLDLLKALDHTIKSTASNTGLHLIFAVSYGSRAEITEAAREIARKVRAGVIQPEEVDEKMIQSHLATSANDDPDLIIRTSGECRLSNFMLWQAAYSELFFTPVLWPDFTKRDLHAALETFGSRERRFGGLALHENTAN
jgi:undecaprenyl diphosphate synthase